MRTSNILRGEDIGYWTKGSGLRAQAQVPGFEVRGSGPHVMTMSMEETRVAQNNLKKENFLAISLSLNQKVGFTFFAKGSAPGERGARA